MLLGLCLYWVIISVIRDLIHSPAKEFYIEPFKVQSSGIYLQRY